MLMELTRTALGCAITFGPVVVLLSLLNLRDRRTSQLRGGVLSQLPLHELRGFGALHQGPGSFVIANPWDAGSAGLLAGLAIEVAENERHLPW